MPKWSFDDENVVKTNCSIRPEFVPREAFAFPIPRTKNVCSSLKGSFTCTADYLVLWNWTNTSESHSFHEI